MALIPQAHELIATRKYVHRMTGHNTRCLPHTDYVLLALDTVVGRFCAERIKTAIDAVVTDVDVSIRYLPDLRPLDIEGLHHGWEHLCITLDAIHRHYKSDVIYNITGEFSAFAGLMHGYATRIGTRMIYTFNPHAPLVIIDVSPHGSPADVTFYQDNAS